MRVILIPGMGCAPAEGSNWYSWFRDEVQQRPNVDCILHTFPDPHQCRESIWVPHVQSLIRQPDQSDEGAGTPDATDTSTGSTGTGSTHQATTNDAARFADAILVGHSSGAACAMRLLEQCARDKTPLAGCILVAAAYTDLGDETERLSEYFNRPWDWTIMPQGISSRRIVLFHSTDDFAIPVDEARYIARQLGEDGVDYRERTDQSHFFQPFPELLQVIDDILSEKG